MEKDKDIAQALPFPLYMVNKLQHNSERRKGCESGSLNKKKNDHELTL